jgi:hypothetical protein
VSNPILEARVTRSDAERFDEIAGTWNKLQLYLDVLTENDLCKLLNWEINNQRRLYIINRVKSRHNRLRDARERHELLETLR